MLLFFDIAAPNSPRVSNPWRVENHTFTALFSTAKQADSSSSAIGFGNLPISLTKRH
jgi:hypothetical protein